MNEYIVVEDRTKLVCYTILNLILTVLLMIVSIYFYSIKVYIIAFFGITGIWFSVKAMCKYASRWFKKTPVCEFKSKEVIIHSLPEKNSVMKYSEIKEVKILRDFKSVKLFFSGDKVTHPSGWNYVGAVYLFQRGLLDEVETKVEECLKVHNVKVNVVEK